MRPSQGTASARISACACLTAFGDAEASLAALLAGKSALRLVPVLGREGGDAVPLALLNERPLDETPEPLWYPALERLLQPVLDRGFGSPRRPVYFTSSNFGVGALYAFRRSGDRSFLDWGATATCVEWLRSRLGLGPNVTLFSHACVSAHLGLIQAARALNAGLADEALVLSFDFLSPFVSGGFHALKILNGEMPAPYQARDISAIGLGDGAGWAVLTRDTGDFRVATQALHNELFHFTANQPDGEGFRALLSHVSSHTRERRLWVKGHGTGTLEAGRLESTALATGLPEAPLVGWKGALGHTLGSCGLVELAIALAAIRRGEAPGTVGTQGPAFTPQVATSPLKLAGFDSLLCLSNAFGGAHAALLLDHA